MPTYITPLKAPSHAGLPPVILVTCGFDMLRDVGHAYALKLAAAGNRLTYPPLLGSDTGVGEASTDGLAAVVGDASGGGDEIRTHGTG